jgi:hypothetical protein
MRSRTITAASAATLLLALTACGGEPGNAKSSASPESSPTKPAPSTASTTPSPSPTDGKLAIGQSHRWNGLALDETTATTGTTTVLSYSHDVRVPGWPADALDADEPLWVAVEIKVCNDKGGTVAVSQTPWSLGFPDDSRVESSFLEGPGLPKPEYPTAETKVKVGDCLRGKIPFVIERAQRPDRIIYETLGPDPVEWAVPKA